MTKLKAVMFDMDGVLIDSERLSLSMWEKVNEALGMALCGITESLRNKNMASGK